MFNEYDNDNLENETVENEAEPAAEQPVTEAEPVSEPYYTEAAPTMSGTDAPVYTPGPYTQDPYTQPDPRIQYRARDPWSNVDRTYKEPWKDPVYTKPDQSFSYTPGIHPQPYDQPVQRAEPEKKKKKKKHGFLKAVALILVCALLSAGISYAVVSSVIKNTDFSKVAPKTIVIGGENAPAADGESAEKPKTEHVVSTGEEMEGDALYVMGCDQVVGIKTAVTTTNIFGQTTSGAVSGSGFIISSDGYIVTNYHVIEYAVKYGYPATVLLYDGTAFDAEIIGYEEENDIAVIKIEASGLSAVKLGSSDVMSVGEKVYAIGNPLGELEYTMTSGIVSALDRVIRTTDPTTGESQSINMFQIDAAVNSGNSGGPVYNSKGEVIGIVSAKYSEAGVEGLGFAIPIDDALNIISDLIENGYVTGKPYFGITVSSITASYAQYYGLVEGALVQSVVEGSCAETAGLEAGDIITQLGEYPVKSKDELLTAKKNYKAGDTVEITAYRNGEYLTFVLTFDEEPAETVEVQPEQPIQQSPFQQYQGGWGNFGTSPFEG